MKIMKAVSGALSGVTLMLITSYSSLLATVPLKQQREAAYQKNPSDNTAKYQWAIAAPCSTAIRLYKEIESATTAHDTLKAAACNALGEYSFSLGDYKSAAGQFKISVKYANKSSVRDRWALSLFCDGQYDAALTLWSALALEMKKEFGVVADFYSGCAELHKGKYTEAISKFEKCGTPDHSKPFTVEALSGKHFCLVKTGRQKDADLLSEKLKQFLLPSIDWPSFNGQIPVAVAKVEPVENKDPQSENEMDGFTVQVGAFSTLENASALQNKLLKQFKNVAVATVTLDDRTFYRVRVGSFTTREDAELFVVDSVQKAGFTGKAVPKKMPDQN